MISINFWWKIRVGRVKFRESLGKEEGDRTGIGAAEGEREKGKQAHALLDSEKPVPELVTVNLILGGSSSPLKHLVNRFRSSSTYPADPCRRSILSALTLGRSLSPSPLSTLLFLSSIYSTIVRDRSPSSRASPSLPLVYPVLHARDKTGGALESEYSKSISIHPRFWNKIDIIGRGRSGNEITKRRNPEFKVKGDRRSERQRSKLLGWMIVLLSFFFSFSRSSGVFFFFLCFVDVSIFFLSSGGDENYLLQYKFRSMRAWLDGG